MSNVISSWVHSHFFFLALFLFLWSHIDWFIIYCFGTLGTPQWKHLFGPPSCKIQQIIKTLQNFIYKKHRIFGKCTKILKTRDKLKDIKLAQTRCQKLSISTTNRL